jgi:nitronate monooxygenase
MAGSSTPELAIAVCNAGGLGSLGCHGMTADELRSIFARMRASTNQPFNLNFLVYPAPKNRNAYNGPYRGKIAALVQKPRTRCATDSPPEMKAAFDSTAIAALKDAGIILFSSATTVAEARVLTAAGIDAVIAQGWEAGGHRGSHEPTVPIDGVGTLACSTTTSTRRSRSASCSAHC